jgi:nucleoside-diphosphate-sugar epimerase
LYAASKLESEQICRRICEDNRIALTIFRLAPVLGEENAGNAARLIEAIDKNRFVWIGDGENLKTLIYKRDVARACVLLIEKKSNETEIFNLAAEPIKMKDFVLEISKRLNKRIFPLRIPAFFLRTVFLTNSKTFNLRRINKISDTVEKWLSDDVYSAGKIAEVYEYQPSVSIREAIARQVDYYRASRANKK